MGTHSGPSPRLENGELAWKYGIDWELDDDRSLRAELAAESRAEQRAATGGRGSRLSSDMREGYGR